MEKCVCRLGTTDLLLVKYSKITAFFILKQQSSNKSAFLELKGTLFLLFENAALVF